MEKVMKIEFVNITTTSEYDDECEKHEVRLNGKRMFSGSEGICPEDVYFYRCMPDPFDCETLLKEVIQAVKEGKEVIIEYKEELKQRK